LCRSLRIRIDRSYQPLDSLETVFDHRYDNAHADHKTQINISAEEILGLKVLVDGLANDKADKSYVDSRTQFANGMVRVLAQ
jgi:hypothetical protein